MNRIFCCLLLLFVLLLPAGAQVLRPDRPVIHSPILSFDALVGRRLDYDISFLWFDHLARGSFSLDAGPRPGTYRAVLEGHTLGVAAWLTSDRVQSYVSLMEREGDGHLRALRYESRIAKRKGKRFKDHVKRFIFDHQHHQVKVQKLDNGHLDWEKVLPMADGPPPCDILTAFFNFREGAYGPLVPGGHYTISTFSPKGTGKAQIDLLRDDQRPHIDFFPKGGMVARVRVDPEVFDSKEGGIYVWLDDRMLPARGIVQNVIGLGDVLGKLHHRK